MSPLDRNPPSDIPRIEHDPKLAQLLAALGDGHLMRCDYCGKDDQTHVNAPEVDAGESRIASGLMTPGRTDEVTR